MSTATLTPRELASLQSACKEGASQPERLMDISELAMALGLSVATVNRRVKEGTIPSIKVGWLRKYRLSSVMAALESQ